MNIEKFEQNYQSANLNTKIIKRNIQLTKLGIAELDIYEEKLYKSLKENLSSLKIYKSDKELGNLYIGKSKYLIDIYYSAREEIIYVYEPFYDELSTKDVNIRFVLKLFIELNKCYPKFMLKLSDRPNSYLTINLKIKQAPVIY